MSFWDDVLALTPELAWMARETSGTSIADDSGNAHTGTITGTPTTMGDTSLITNLPTEASIKMPGGTVYISVADAAALDVAANNFTAIVTIKPTDLAAQRDIIGKLDCWQIWQETSGRITGYFSPAWTSVLSSNDTNGKLVAGQVSFLAIRQDGSGAAEASVWIGHQGASLNKVGSTTKSNNLTNSAGSVRMAGSSSPGTGRTFKGNIQAFAYWPNTALTDTQLGNLFTKWDTVETPTTPDAPSITKPTSGQTFSNGMLVTVVDGADTGEFGTLEYKVEYNLNSGGWTTLIDWTTTRPVDYLIDVSAYDEGTLQLRAYMRRSATTVSDASATVTVTIAHNANHITTPTIEWAWSGAATMLGAYASVYESVDPTPVALSRWQIAAYGTGFASPIEWEHTTHIRFGFNAVQDPSTGGWDTSYLLSDDTDYEIRVQYEDQLGITSDWSDPVRGKTAVEKVVSLGGVYLLAEDETVNDAHGAYVHSDSTAGTPEANSAALHGQRFPYQFISGGADEFGVLCDNLDYVVYNGGSYAHNSPSQCPNWRLRIRGWLAEEAIAIGHGLLGLQDSDSNPRLYLYRAITTGVVTLDWKQDGGGSLGGSTINTGVVINPGEEFDIEIIWDGSTIDVNGTTVYTPGTAPSLNRNIEEIIVGHHSHVGPQIGGYHMMQGVLLEYEFDWNGTAEISYLFTDPQVPDAPALTRG